MSRILIQEAEKNGVMVKHLKDKFILTSFTV